MRLLVALVALTAAAWAADTGAAAGPVTFNKDIVPILQKNCQNCHRPGNVAPMSLLTYESARPWAKAMKTAVATRKMPPWFADPRHGPYLNDRSLKQNEIDAIAQWADAGAPEGDAKDAPVAVAWPEGWAIKPDIIVDGPVTDVPATPKNNVVEWITVIMPTGFTKDTWVTSVQIKPEFPAASHHICIGYLPHNPNYKYGVAYWADKERDEEGSALPDKGPTFLGGGTPRSNDGNAVAGGPRTLGQSGGAQPPGGAEDCYLPGNFAADYRAINAAKLIPAGSDITFNLHYTPNGTAVTDHVKVGLTVLDKAPERRYVSFLTTSPTDAKRFAIPPNDPNWLSPPAEVTFLQDAELVYLMPHMHFRGKDMTYILEFPDGTKKTILSVPHYDFNWQLGYDTSIKVPKGTVLHVDAHFDNSVNNKFNPNPNKTVYYGTMTWEEMMNPFYGVVVGKDVDPKTIVHSKYLQVGGGG
jgi:hypothetical protein